MYKNYEDSKTAYVKYIKEHKKEIDEKISEIIKKYNISVFSCNERTKAITKLN